MQYSIGKLLGLIRIIIGGIIIIISTLMLPVSLFYKDYPPTLLNNLYSIEWFNWKWGVIIICSLLIYFVAGCFIFVGWHQFRPFRVIPADVMEVYERKHRNYFNKDA